MVKNISISNNSVIGNNLVKRKYSFNVEKLFYFK